MTFFCPECHEEFTELRDGKVPTHDFPKPCIRVCPGSGQLPEGHVDADDMNDECVDNDAEN